MKIGFVILCRYNSSRLPGKILKEIHGVSILKRITNRLKLISDTHLIVATSTEPTDQPIQDFCILNDIMVYRGSLENVSQRFYEAAASISLDYAIRINGDNLFIDLENIERMLVEVRSNPIDFYSNVKGRTFPYGMSVEILNTVFYKNLLPRLNNDYYKEHVTIYLYENDDIGKRKYFYNNKYPEMQSMRLAIDEEKDLHLAEKIITYLGDKDNSYTFEDLINAIAKTRL